MTHDPRSKGDEHDLLSPRDGRARIQRDDGADLVLPRAWSLVSVPGADHPVVVGPGGVVLLAVRRQSSERVRLYDRGLWVDGRRTHELTTTDHQAGVVSVVLSEACRWAVHCEPVVVVHTTDLVVRSRPDDVHVLHAHVLHRWLEHLPARLSDEEVEQVVDRAAALATLADDAADRAVGSSEAPAA
jgi:hypothetical protein